MSASAQPAVESHHEPVVPGSGDHLRNTPELIVRQRKRLLHEDRLASLQRTADQLGVRVVTRHNEDSVNGFVIEYGISAGRGRGKTETPLRAVEDSDLFVATCDNCTVASRAVRQQHRGRVAARADEPDGEALLGGAARRRWLGEIRFAVLRCAMRLVWRIFEENPDSGERPGGQIRVHVARLIYREDTGDKRLNFNVLMSYQVQETCKIPTLSPADITGRIVDAVKLIAVVVPARASYDREKRTSSSLS